MESREGTVRSIVWRDVFPGVLLVRTLRIAFRFRVLLLAFGGYLLSVLGAWIIGLVLFGGIEDPWIERAQRELLELLGGPTRGSIFAVDATQPPSLGGPALPHEEGMNISTDPAATSPPEGGIAKLLRRSAAAPAAAWAYLSSPLVGLFRPGLSPTALGYLLLRNLWNVLVWGFFGGAIARIAAFELTRQERLGLERAASQTLMRYPAHVLAPLIAGLAVFLVALPLTVAGVFIRMEGVAWVAGMLWFLVLLVGLLLAVLAIGLLLGWPLMWAAIAVEQSDAFDAVSRAYAYVFQRPFHLAVYVALAILLGVVGAALVFLFVDVAVALSDWAIGWGSGGQTLAALQGRALESVDRNSWLAGAASGRDLWTRMLRTVAAAYPIGYLWAAAVGVYLLLRWHVDGAETDEIADDELEAAAALPPLKPHESGIPEVEPQPAERRSARPAE